MQTTFFWLLFFLSGILAKHVISNQNQSSYPDIQTYSSIAPNDSLKSEKPETKDIPHSTSLAYQAIDRQCGSCHQDTHSTNTKALAIFNLADECWYCKLTLDHSTGIIRRTQGSSFSTEERIAILSLLEKLDENIH